MKLKKMGNKTEQFMFLGVVFYLIAGASYLFTRDLILLFNFIYIGTVVIFGLAFYSRLQNNKKEKARRFIQFFVGMYMVIVVGYVWEENIQLESFIINLLAIIGGDVGAFATASILHYLIAKTIGVSIIGRNWCGWACWFPAILNLFPYKESKGRIRKLEFIPYVNLIATILISCYIYYNEYNYGNYKSNIRVFIFTSLGIYYTIGIVMTLLLKDNRAICKYFCAVPIIQKIFMPLSIFYIKLDKDRCIDCKLCEKVCSMDVNITKYRDEGLNVTAKSCIQCRKCVESCPKKALSIKANLKRGKTREFINYKSTDK